MNAHENDKCQDVLDSEADGDDDNVTKIRDPRADIEGDIYRRLLQFRRFCFRNKVNYKKDI